MPDRRPILMDLSARGLIRVRGKDAAKFLQSQLSNDIKGVDPAHGQLSAYCNPKGRMFAIFRIFHGGEETYYLDLEPGLLEPVTNRLKMFVMRAKVSLDDAREAMISIGLSGSEAPAMLEEIAVQAPDEDYAQGAALDGTIMRLPGAAPRYQLLLPVDSAQAVWDKLAEHTETGGHEDWRTMDILSELPVVRLETMERFTPQMLNLDELGGVSFNKGCYPGQEIVARTHFLGKAKQKMLPGRMQGKHIAIPGDAVFDQAEPRQAAGYIVDAMENGDGVMLLTTVKEGAGEKVYLGSVDGPAISIASQGDFA